VVRGPLVKIMGLAGLLKDHVSDPVEREELLNYLLDASDELDAVIHEITDKTSQLKKV
jgi:hypothetical protein